MLVRKVCVSIISLCCTLPMYSNAAELSINNHTNYDSTSIINNGACSNILGEVGISRAHTENNRIPANKVRFACIANQHNCKADVYITANCTGPRIATLYFDIDTGIKGVPQSEHPEFSLEASGFTVTLEQK